MTNDFAKLLLPLSLSLGWLALLLLLPCCCLFSDPKIPNTFPISVRAAASAVDVAVALYAAQFSKQSAVDVILPLAQQPKPISHQQKGNSGRRRRNSGCRGCWHHPVTFTAIHVAKSHSNCCWQCALIQSSDPPSPSAHHAYPGAPRPSAPSPCS